MINMQSSGFESEIDNNVLVLPAWREEIAKAAWEDGARQIVVAEQQVPRRLVTDLSLRAKVIDSCGLTCTFCHNEGTPVAVDALRSVPVNIGSAVRNSGRVSVFAATNGVNFIPGRMEPNKDFRAALHILKGELGLNEIHLTGGEPSLHSELPGIIEIAAQEDYKVRMTSNGEKGSTVMADYASAGLEKINFSIFGTIAGELAAVQHERFRDEVLAAKKIDALRASITSALDVGIEAHANIVMPDETHTERIIRLINEFEQRLVVRILPDLDRGEETYRAIYQLLASLGAMPVDVLVEAGSSNARVKYDLPDRRQIYFKQIRPTRLDSCQGCALNNETDCKEGFYGTRLYVDRAGEYIVGVCIQRMDMTLPLKEFAGSDLSRDILNLRDKEHASLSEQLGTL